MKVLDEIEELINDCSVAINVSDTTSSQFGSMLNKLKRAKLVLSREREIYVHMESTLNRIDRIDRSLEILLYKIKMLSDKKKIEPENEK